MRRNAQKNRRKQIETYDKKTCMRENQFILEIYVDRQN